MSAMGRLPRVGQIKFLHHLLSDYTGACRPKGDSEGKFEKAKPLFSVFSVTIRFVGEIM